MTSDFKQMGLRPRLSLDELFERRPDSIERRWVARQIRERRLPLSLNVRSLVPWKSRLEIDVETVVFTLGTSQPA